MKKILQKFDIIGLVFLIASVVWYSVSNIWSRGNLALAAAGGALIIIGLAANYRQIMASMGKRSSKYAANYVVSLILILAVVSGLNFVGQRHLKRFDVTGNSRFSLAPQTIKVIENLDRLGVDVDIKAFFPGGNHEPLQALFTEYRALSRHLHYEFIDPDRQNDVAARYDVTVYGAFQNPMSGESVNFGTVIISYGDRREKIEKRSEEIEEQDLTNALIKVSRSEMKKVYFVQGHGEKNPDDSEQAGYSLAKKALEGQGYTVEAVNIAAEGKVPEDASVLVLAGLRTTPFPQELEFIRNFLDAGGGALFMMDPPPSPALQDFFNDWGIAIDDDVVLDVSGAGRLMGASESMPLVLAYEQHQITERFSGMTFFPLTRSIQPAESIPDGVAVQTLFKSNANSWGETNLNESNADYNPEQDLQGPLSLAVAASKEVFTESSVNSPDDSKADSESDSNNNTPIHARLVVTGTSNFAIDAYFSTQGNGNLFMNMVSWLAQDEDLISIRPRPLEDRRILLSQGQLVMLRFFVIFLLPGIALVLGIVVVTRRRRM